MKRAKTAYVPFTACLPKLNGANATVFFTSYHNRTGLHRPKPARPTRLSIWANSSNFPSSRTQALGGLPVIRPEPQVPYTLHIRTLNCGVYSSLVDGDRIASFDTSETHRYLNCLASHRRPPCRLPWQLQEPNSRPFLPKCRILQIARLQQTSPRKRLKS